MKKARQSAILLAAFALVLLAHSLAQAFTLNVVDQNGAPIGTYKWLAEEDTTHPVNLGLADNNSLSVSIYKSYNPVFATGDNTDLTPLDGFDPLKRYYISVLPPGYALGGANIAAGQTTATVICQNLPIPTAQIRVYAFHDNGPINGAPDDPAEAPLPGFKVVIFDTFGQQATDTFGNPIGTTYLKNLDGSFQMDIDGNPIMDVQGGEVLTDANGEALIKNLAPGKYGVRVVPTDGLPWSQTSTIEGTPGIDAWVRANEPPFFDELGFLSWHAFMGFVLPMEFPAPAPGATVGTITGAIHQSHSNKPPLQLGGNVGKPASAAWVGLNNLSGADEQVFAAPCNPDTGEFTINNVPPGTYQLAIWDTNLDYIIDFRTITVPPTGGTVAMGQVPINSWFGNFEGVVFNDADEDGFRDPGEMGLANQAVNLRFRDGSIYQSTVTDMMGEYGFNEVFPWFKWIVTEVDFARFKATGATFIVDNGGPITDFARWINPQPQVDDLGVPIINPNTGDNLSRTEVGPVLTQGMILYFDQTNFADWGKKAYVVGPDNIMGTLDDIPGENGGISGIVYYDTTRAENDPRFNGAEPWQPGIPNVNVELYRILARDINGKPSTLEFVDATQTDSFDDSQPTGCIGDEQSTGFAPYVDCSETLKTWNQLRPAVFNGGYAFNNLTPGDYVVKVIPPAGYKIVKNDDKNVDFGMSFTPGLLAAPPACVGAEVVVPPVLSFDGATENPSYDPANPAKTMPLCDMKEVRLAQSMNSAADFFIFTDVPKAARFVGLITNDVAAAFAPGDPRVGDKFGPSWMPVSFQDYMGNEIGRAYTDQWGQYNILIPGSYTVNVPNPTGVSPNMVNVVLNHPGTPTNPDPWYDPAYAVFAVNFDAWPAKTTQIDTPNLPKTPLVQTGIVDCFPVAGTPVISRVDAGLGGPYVANAPETVTLTSAGLSPLLVPNPLFNPDCPGPVCEPPTITVNRDFGFGSSLGMVTVDGVSLPVLSWSPATITVLVGAGTPTGQIEVTRGDNGLRTPMGVTLHVKSGAYDPNVVRVAAGGSIQAAIDAAPAGSLILVESGDYVENLLMYKPVKLQGYGAISTNIRAAFFDLAAQNAWLAKVADLVAAGDVTLVDGQPVDFPLDRGAGITVLGKAGDFQAANNALIDGFSVIGALKGGGIFVNGHASYLEISNNNIEDNGGNFGGGIRMGWPSLVNATNDGYNSAFNDHINIHNNRISGNSAIDGGGGIAIFNGADDYNVNNNLVCGNFALLYGGGIAHYGLSDNGTIYGNGVLYNAAFDEGGGIMLAGELVPAGAPLGTLTPGAGSVVVDTNAIFANNAGDDGGGIRTLSFNGQDVVANPDTPSAWHELAITNNMVVNNVTADAGGGLSFDDTARVAVIHNTVAHNDSTATSIDAFTTSATISDPQVAGIMGRAHSAGLQGAFGAGLEQTYSDPALYNNIVFNNRSFHYDADLPNLISDGYWDLGVFGTLTPATLNPEYCVLTDNPLNAGYSGTNILGDPLFDTGGFNDLQALLAGNVVGVITVNYLPPLPWAVNYHITPGSPAINAGAANIPPIGGWMPILNTDFDRQPRGATPDIGADELVGAAPNVTPVNVSATAANGVPGSAQQVVAVWSDANGAMDLNNMQLQVGTNATGGIIKVRYVRSTNLLHMVNDAGNAWLGGFTPGSANVISNSRGSLNCATTTVTASGNNITVSFNLTPAATYTGSKNLSMYAVDNSGAATAWQSRGTWSINSPPVNVSINSPTSAAGNAQTLNVVWSDGNGATDLKNVQLQVGTGGAGSIVKARYIRATNLLYLLNDTGSAWVGGFAPGSANTIVNSRGTLNCAATTVSAVGNNLTVNFSFTPAAGFTGAKPLYMYAIDNKNATTPGFQPKGTWTITP
ncbi:MAG: hypothetical protein HZC51_02770 [Nitrospirae bacterium]|nr:hypothetical protein [Nitrospirota bacterium]